MEALLLIWDVPRNSKTIIIKDFIPPPSYDGPPPFRQGRQEKASPCVGKLSPKVTDEGADSDIMRIGAHSSVGFAATFSILEKASKRVRTSR